MAGKNKAFSKIGFHEGEALLRVAGHYSTLQEVVFETVQNALDAAANVIRILVNLKNRSLIITDDGNGVSKEKFDLALMQICKSVKREDKLGQFGMGLVSPLGKCHSFTFTSTPKSNPRGYLRWTFETNGIKKQSQITGIPVESVDLCFGRMKRGQNSVPWRTELRITKFTGDRILSRVTTSSLREGVLERFSTTMRRLNAVVEIKIISAEGEMEADRFVANEYQGQRIPVEYITNEDAGRTTFQLFLAKTKGRTRNGKVVIGEDRKDFRISFKQFIACASEFLSKEVAEALNSGIFEGEILSEKARLTPDRKKIEQNDALVGFCIAIEEWFEKKGVEFVTQAKDEVQHERYQTLGIQSMKVIESLLRQPEFEGLKDVIQKSEIGSIGEHHTPPDEKIVGKQDALTTSVHGGSSGKPSSDGAGETNRLGKSEHKGHTPLTVGGPKGRPRLLVKSNSLGLQFLYESMPGSDKIWIFDRSSGVITFNTRHLLWVKCDEAGEKPLMRFQEYVALKALTLEAAPEEWREEHRLIIYDSMPVIVHWMLHGDSIAGRKGWWWGKSKKQ